MAVAGTRLFQLAWRVTLLALCLALVLKWGVVDGFEVRGNSMEPLLRDREPDPDKIAVFKRWFDVFEPARFDLVVFERPEREAGAALASDLVGERFVKRLAGFPGETVRIEGGDLFVTPAGAAVPERRPVARTPERIRQMFRPVSRFEPGAAGDGAFRIPAGAAVEDGTVVLRAGPRGEGGEEEGVLRYVEFVRDDWWDEQGRRHQGESAVNDTALAAVVTALDPTTEVAVKLREKGDIFVLRLSTREAARLLRVTGTREEPIAAQPTVPSRLPAGVPVRVLFANVDDRLLLWQDDRLVLDVPYQGNRRVIGVNERNEPAVEVESGAARLTEIEVLRDVYYTERDCEFAVRAPLTVPEGEYFLLGDNSVNSRDSRHFGPVPRSRFVGRPFLIFLPFDRWRLL